MHTIPLRLIRNDSSVSPRHRIDRERVAEFAALYAEEGLDALPPVELIPLGDGSYLIADGWHRLHALAHLGQGEAPATVLALEPGEEPASTAYRRALACSAISSKPLSRAEKHDAIRRLLAERPEASDREIGRLVGVDHKTVGRLRRGEDGNETAAAGRSVSPEEAAKRLFRAFEKAYEARGLGVADFFRGDRSGARLAGVLAHVYGEAARERALSFRGWLDGAIEALEAEAAERQEAA